MNKKLFILFLISVNGLTNLAAQELKLFDLRYYEKDSTQNIAFISLSDIYGSDSLTIPDNAQYFKLVEKDRKRFLSKTNISETDKIFVYDYSIDSLISITVKNSKVVACLNIYRIGEDGPFSPDDYMIGFEINKKFLTGSDKYFTNSLAYVGKESPFVRGQVKPIIWKKIEPNDFPSKDLPSYDTSYAGKCVTGEVYKFEMEGLQYFVQDLVRLADKEISVKRLIVIDLKTKETVCERLFYSGESASFAPLDNQWTGKLFKNKPPVIFGFHWVSFGCPSITLLNPTESNIYINCDNRH